MMKNHFAGDYGLKAIIPEGSFTPLADKYN